MAQLGASLLFDNMPIPGFPALAFFVAISAINAQEEILNNPDFEQPFTENDWVTFCGSLTQDDDAYSGNYAAKLTDRCVRGATALVVT